MNPHYRLRLAAQKPCARLLHGEIQNAIHSLRQEINNAFDVAVVHDLVPSDYAAGSEIQLD